MTSNDRKILRQTWHGMIQRCHNALAPGYKHYGARGVKVCERWRRSFMAFAADMGPRPAGTFPSGRALYSIDRIDVDGNYEPSNCRWATMDEQKRNRTDSRWLTIGDRTMIASDWAREANMSTALLTWRLKRMSPESAISPTRTKAVRAESHPRTKMTWEVARAIRESSETALALAARYGVSDTLVAQVRLNQRWVGPLAPACEKPMRIENGRKLKSAQAAEIRTRAEQGECLHVLAAEFSVSWSTVRMILNGKIWKNVEPRLAG